jgi:uncharacterized FAD-dependent dehydrogenase
MTRELVLILPPSEEPPAIDDERRLVELAARELRLAPSALACVRPTKLSFDARPRHRAWRLALEVWRAGEAVPPRPALAPPTCRAPAADAPHVVVIGSGPAGLFAALDLLAAGLRVTVLERGRDVQARRHPIAELNRGHGVDPDCNYCFGEGGAGTYSDGKLYTRSGTRAEVRGVLEALVAHGAPREILVSWRPHVGSNRLPEVVRALRETILRSGGSVRFGCRAEEVETAELGDGGPARRRRVRAVVARELDRDERVRLACDAAVLAAGHSALDALLMALRAGARLEPKGFAMGVRVEHPQPWLDERQYGGLRGACDLPASFYELAQQVDGRGVYSFCMCPGGFIVPASVASDRVVVNGMSLSRRDSPFANSGLVVQIEPEDWCGERGQAWGWSELLRRAARLGAPHVPVDGALPARAADDPLFGVSLQVALETVACAAGGGANRAPAQRADLALAGDGRPGEAIATSYRPGVAACDLATVLPPGLWSRIRAALAAFDQRLPGYASDIGQLVGVETRTSSPVRIARDPESLASVEVAGLYPSGEGAGYAGGIVSAALDGRHVARAIAIALARR